MKIGKYLTLADCTKSTTADRKGIKNNPTAAEIVNIKETVLNIYDPLCDHFGIKIPFNSFFRCATLNTAVGGAKASNHLFGYAIDLDDWVNGVTNMEIFNYIQNNLEFDELIQEYKDANGLPKWIHVAYNKLNRKRIKYIR